MSSAKVTTTVSQSRKRRAPPQRQAFMRTPSKKAKQSLWARVPRNPFPDRTLTKLKYVDRISLAAGGSAPANHYFRCNSLFDPDLTGVGHQPLGFDEYAKLYSHYVVHSAFIEVIFTGPDNVGANAEKAHIVGITINNDSADNRLWNATLEDATTVKTIIHDGSGPNVAVLTKGYKEKKIFPANKLYSTHSPVNNNPAEQTNWQVFAIRTVDTLTTSPIQALVTITYLAEFYERKDLDVS